MTTFKELGLHAELMKSLDDLGFTEPTPVQEKTIPFIVESKKDLIALAQTGTGKTAAFGLPILNQLEATGKNLQAIILCPTRELCLQITQDIKKYAAHTKGVSVTSVYGGARMDLQIKALKRGTHIVVGTPGRVHDLIRRKVLRLQTIEWVVLDEADEMLDMGFKDDLDAILEQTPATRQTLLFSATISPSVRSIAKRYMNDLEEIRVGEKNVGADKVAHEYYVVQARDRFEALKRILDSLPGVYGILFCRTRIETQDIADKLKRAHYDTEALHGDVSQTMRTKIMDSFKHRKAGLLVATDVAARGIDVSNLSHVINYSLPDQNDVYTHRSGRTGRARKSGVSISLIGPRDVRRIKELEAGLGKTMTYKKIPSGEEICLNHAENFLKEVASTEGKTVNNEHYYSEIESILHKVNKEDLIKYLIVHTFSNFLDSHKNTRDLNAEIKTYTERRDERNKVSLKINFGRKDRFDIKALFLLFNSNRNLKSIKIGRIDLMPEHSIFSVDKNGVDKVKKYLHGTNFRGKKIEISIDTASASYPRRNYQRTSYKRTGYQRKRSGGSGRGFERKRRGY